MKILDRYIGKIILHYTLISMAVLLGLFTFISFLDQLSNLGRGSYNLTEAIIYITLTIPRMIYELFPMAALIGTILALSMLAADSELIVIRASGVSMLQISGAVLKMGGIFVMASILIGELLSPHTETQAQRGKAEALQQNIKQHTNFGLWMRDNSTYVNIGEVLPDLTLRRIKVFEFGQDKKLGSLVSSDSATFDNQYWIISNVKQTLIDDDGTATVKQSDAAKWETRLIPEIFSIFLIKPDQLSFWQLSRYIAHLKENQQRTDSYELAFWGKLMLPISTAVMVILAIPFVFVSVRSGSLGSSLFVGIMLGLGFYLVNRGFGYVVLASGFSPLLGAVVPVAVFLALALVMMQRVN